MLIKVNLRGMQHFVRHGKKPALMFDLPMGDLGLSMLMFIKGGVGIHISTFGTWLMGEMLTLRHRPMRVSVLSGSIGLLQLGVQATHDSQRYSPVFVKSSLRRARGRA
tara:strand:+ start:224 stop:547 length:324 start_codon:yes stop_codon:yes gene_type:complete